MKTVRLMTDSCWEVVYRGFRACGQSGTRSPLDASLWIETSRGGRAYTPGMFTKHRLAEVAALLGDPGRAGMGMSLWDGTARPAGELSRIAGVAPATASAHLARLVSGGLLCVERRGRHRYYRLAGPAVAQALESLAGVLPSHVAGGPRGAGEGAIPPPPPCSDHPPGPPGGAV